MGVFMLSKSDFNKFFSSQAGRHNRGSCGGAGDSQRALETQQAAFLLGCFPFSLFLFPVSTFPLDFPPFSYPLLTTAGVSFLPRDLHVEPSQALLSASERHPIPRLLPWPAVGISTRLDFRTVSVDVASAGASIWGRIHGGSGDDSRK